MRRAMTYARDFNALIMHFAQDGDLAGSGVMNAGELATRLGLGGIPVEAEAIALDRDMRLVNMIRGRYHAALVSSRMSLEIIARAKDAGLPVTCATSINHVTLNENDIGNYRTFCKLSPPLRHENDRVGLVEACGAGQPGAPVQRIVDAPGRYSRSSAGALAEGGTGGCHPFRPRLPLCA